MGHPTNKLEELHENHVLSSLVVTHHVFYSQLGQGPARLQFFV